MSDSLRKIALYGLGVMSVLSIALQPIVVRADTLTLPGSNPINVSVSGLGSGQQVVSTLLRVITSVAVILFVILLVVGGIQYLGSFGNEESTTKAKKLIIDAVVGLFIVLAAFGIASFIFGQLGVSGLSGFGLTR
jgi:phosphatidylglycerophosphatase A